MARISVGRDGAAAAVQWMANRFAGISPPSDCAIK